MDVALALGITLAGVLAILIYCAVLTGRVANEFGADPQKWQWLMLPFGIVGPFLARMILSRRGR